MYWSTIVRAVVSLRKSMTNGRMMVPARWVTAPASEYM